MEKEWLCLNFRTSKSKNLTVSLQGWAGERCRVGGGELCCGEVRTSTKNFHPPLLALISCSVGTWSYHVGARNGRQEYALPYESMSLTVSQNISFLANMSASCEFGFCVTVTVSLVFCATDGSGFWAKSLRLPPDHQPALFLPRVFPWNQNILHFQVIHPYPSENKIFTQTRDLILKISSR